jgi:hypothetical protein
MRALSAFNQKLYEGALYAMKKIMVAALGLSLLSGGIVFAQDKMDSSTTDTTKKKKKGKKKKDTTDTSAPKSN